MATLIPLIVGMVSWLYKCVETSNVSTCALFIFFSKIIFICLSLSDFMSRICGI